MLLLMPGVWEMLFLYLQHEKWGHCLILIDNKSQSKSSSDPISHVASIKTTSPTPQASTTTSSEGSKTKDIVKTNSCEIKIEEGGLTTVGVRESCSGKVTIVGHSTVGILV